MKVKQHPDDFRVEEFPTVVPATTGPFAFYQLEKRNWTTPDAVAAICERWKIRAHRVSFAGLKDRHAHTLQCLTVHNGPDRNLSLGTIALTYLGRLPTAYVSEQIRANGFTITLRDLNEEALNRAMNVLPELAAVGVPNYFDDQRFGSVNESGAFVAREMVLGNFERALQIALTEPYVHDRAPAKREKDLLRQHWGNWEKCRTELRRGHAQSIINDLVHRPDDFRGACARLHPELQGMYLAAWQSHLWNKMLSRWISERVPAEERQRIPLKTGDVVAPRRMSEDLLKEWETLELPLPSARLRFDPQAPWASTVAGVMEEEGIPLECMKIAGMREPFFSKGNRLARIPVDHLSWEIGEDEMNRGGRKLTLSFELPRGCYATMVIKQIVNL